MTADVQDDDFDGFGTEAQLHFAAVVDGVYGAFATPAGKVCYLQTKAKIGGDSSKYSQLTKYLVPAREALNIQEMDFNQLLQRDLDDHRIATKLIPYILNPPKNSLPGFFPPIVAVLLPFDQKQQPIEHFSKPSVSTELDPQYPKMRFRMTTHGQACRIQYLVNKNDNLMDPPFAVIRWNPDEAKLVIMDGQHRAMSLLAIERTITKSWHTAPKGARYQPFYEEHVKKWLDQAKQDGTPIDLSELELPVTICWFPDDGEENHPKAHKAARKLFVDVNNSAKPPSEARLVLLSDTELENIFARELLNRLRRDAQWENRLPLYGVEYDNPIKSLTTPRRWSVVTNLEILKDSVVRAVFGPPKLIKNAKASLQGKPALKEMNKFMRDQLQVGKLFPKEFHDGPHRILRETLSNENFPINDDVLHQKLLDAFYQHWGQGILHLICEVEPYRAHLAALQNRYNGWTAADNVQTLAKDALFEGVGMFWTIADGHQLWLDNKKDAQEKKLPVPSQPDVSRAWEILAGEQRKIFQSLRAETYFGSCKPDEVDDSERLYEGLITYAAQVGLVLTWVTLHQLASDKMDPFEIAKAIADAINRTLSSGPVKSRDRKKIFLKACHTRGFQPLNSLPRLEPAYAVYYRYFWLELVLFHENREKLKENGIDLEKATDFLVQCRRAYLELLVEERRKVRLRDAVIKALPEGEQDPEARRMARAEVIEEQAQAQHYWFGGKLVDCRKLITKTLESEIEVYEEDTIVDEAGDDYPTI